MKLKTRVLSLTFYVDVKCATEAAGPALGSYFEPGAIPFFWSPPTSLIRMHSGHSLGDALPDCSGLLNVSAVQSFRYAGRVIGKGKIVVPDFSDLAVICQISSPKFVKHLPCLLL